jgi:hypothetical protein
MILLALLQFGELEIAVGSMHTLCGYEQIKDFIGPRKAVIAGDQDWGFCDRIGLAHVDNKTHTTWPASCTSSGEVRGDIICSNADVAKEEVTVKPCAANYGGDIVLGDHSMTFVTLRV